jgi:hypothetical protein
VFAPPEQSASRSSRKALLAATVEPIAADRLGEKIF